MYVGVLGTWSAGISQPAFLGILSVLGGDGGDSLEAHAGTNSAPHPQSPGSLGSQQARGPGTSSCLARPRALGSWLMAPPMPSTLNIRVIGNTRSHRGQGQWKGIPLRG